MESGEGPRRRRDRFLDEADRILGDDSRDVEPIFGDDEDDLEMQPFPSQTPPPPQPVPRRHRRGPSGETLKRVAVADPLDRVRNRDHRLSAASSSWGR